MGRAPCCDKANVKRGPWSPEEDATLKNYLQAHGTGGNWIALPRKAGLRRCGKSCRLRWLNYLRPDIKHGGFTEEEDSIICNLYNQIGSRWSVIASQLPGRTDNDVKNYWNTKLKKKLLAGKINLNMTNTNGTSSTNAHLIPTTNNATILPASKTPSALLDQPPNSCVPKIETFDSSFLNSSETQNSAASLRTLTGFDSPGLLTQYDLNPFCTNNSRLVDFSAVSLSQEGCSSNINNADIKRASVPPHNGCDEYIRGHHGSALMDFGYGFPYDFMDGVSFEEKAYCHDQVAPTCSITLSDLGCVEIRPPAGLNQSTIINNY